MPSILVSSRDGRPPWWWRCRRRRAAAVIVVAGLMVGTMSGSGSASAEPGYTVVASFADPYEPHGVAVDPSTHDAYVTNWGPASGMLANLLVVDESGDAHTGTVTATIPLGDNPEGVGDDDDPYGVAVDPSTHNVYVVNGGAGTLSVIDESGDASNGKVTATIAVARQPYEVAVDPTNHNVYVPGELPYPQVGGIVSVIDESGDARSGQVIASIPVTDETDGVAVDPATHNVYVASRNYPDNGVVSIIDESGDAATGKVTATVPVGVEPEGVTVDSSSHKVYVANFGSYGSNGSVSVIDGSLDHSGRVIATIAVAEHPYDVAVDPSDHNLYVTSTDYGDKGLLSVIDESGDAGTGHVTTPIVLGGGVADLAVDPSTHSIWVAADNSLLDIAPRPRADLTMSISGPTGAADGSLLVEKVTVANRGPGQANGTVTNLVVPAGLSVSAAPGAVLRGGTLVWNDSSLADGATVSHTITFTVGAGVHATTTIGGVTICTAGYDPDPADNGAVINVRLG